MQESEGRREERRRGGLRERLAALDAGILQWVMGLLCGFIGAFMLVAPHHFDSLLYEGLDPFKTWWGMLALSAGVALLAVAALRPARWICLAAHGAVGLTLLALAASFARNGAWTGMIVYSTLGLGTALAPFRPRPRSMGAGGDLFALLMGAVATVLGTILTAAPGLFRSGYYYGIKPLSVPVLGLVVMGTGFLLFCAQLAPARRLWQLWSVHLAAGLALVVYGSVVALPNRAPTGLALYCGCGAAVALLPWLRRRVANLDTGALRTRLALTLATATSLALILAVAVVTTQVESLAELQVRHTQQVEANAIARNVADYVALNGVRTFSVAALAGQIPLAEKDQGELLAGSLQSYHDVTGFHTLDLAGTPIASSGDTALPPGLLRGLAAQMWRQPVLQLDLVNVEDRPFLVLSAPIRRPRVGDLVGVLIAVFDSSSLERRISREGSSISLANGHGTVIARRDDSGGKVGAGPSKGLPPLPAGWDQRVQAGEELETATGVVAFALVPDLDWVVAVERPRWAALAGVRRGRDLAFGLLLLLIPLAVVGGVFVSRRIARPLGTLASAVGEMTAGNPSAPLGTSGITEVARLSAAFQEMRERLAERTGESERLASELRARAEALAETDRRKDEFLAMLAHELRNPLGAISNASYLLESAPLKPPLERPVSIIRRQVQHLVRMVDDLLDVSRITRGKVELRREPVDLVEVVRHAVEASRATIEAKSHALRVSLPDEPLPLVADATRLEQVLSNLLRNSAKFTQAGGLIEIEAVRDGVGAVVVVRDDGIGIAHDLLPRVFDLFAQGEQALDRSGAGLGIGLTLVRSLVEMHGGRVEAKSDGPGRGSEFVVWLPLVPAHQPQRHAAAAGQGRDLVG